ncbi:MAG: hypothetical protein AABW88_00930 [Nanoarchaeota archaeon]
MKQLLIFSVVFLVACSVQQTTYNSSPQIKIQTSMAPTRQAQQTQTQAATQTQDDSEVVVNCNSTNGEATLYYKNGQKENFDPVCPEKNVAAFISFRQIYYCDGLNVRSRLTRCANNQTCYKGGCI